MDPKKFSQIRPPDCKSYGDLFRFLKECEEPGLTSQYGEPVFAGPFAFALLRTWRFFRKAREDGKVYQEASAEWNARIDRDGEAMQISERERLATLSRAQKESGRQRKARSFSGSDADDLFQYANEKIRYELPTDGEPA